VRHAGRGARPRKAARSIYVGSQQVAYTLCKTRPGVGNPFSQGVEEEYSIRRGLTVMFISFGP
jgi:hypothetical protein